MRKRMKRQYYSTPEGNAYKRARNLGIAAGIMGGPIAGPLAYTGGKMMSNFTNNVPTHQLEKPDNSINRIEKLFEKNTACLKTDSKIFRQKLR